MNALTSLGIADYGSDSDDDGAPEVPVAGPSNPKSASSSLLSSLPPPKNTKKTEGPKKITIPKLRPVEDDNAADDDDRPAKRQKTEGPSAPGGSGKSSLLSMLPAPKKSGLSLPPPKKAAATKAAASTSASKKGDETGVSAPLPRRGLVIEDVTDEEVHEQRPDASAPPIIPRNVISKPPVLVPEQVDEPKESVTAGASILPTVVAAPDLDTWEDFVPPEPTPEDPYPGYYQHPSGTWQQYDPDYYMQFYNRWTGGAAAGVPPKEKAFDGYRDDIGIEANARKVWEEAEVERQKRQAQQEAKRLAEEERKKAEEEGRVQPAYKAPDSKMSRIARTRHQLGGEIMRAMAMQQQIEENLSSGKQARKEARRKYGF